MAVPVEPRGADVLAQRLAEVRRLRDLVEAIASDRALLRVEDVCRVARVRRIEAVPER